MWQLFSAIFLLTACTKIDTTHLGSDLIPAVDNVSTFETTLDVVANSYIGNEEYRLNASNPHIVGAISHDPLFGSSKASMFFEMKPLDYPYIFVHYDSLKGADVGFDSAVLVLDYLGYYGDSNEPVNLKLYQVDREIKADTAINPTYNLQPDLAANHSILWGTKTVQANQFKDSISIKRGDSVYEKVVNQLRIRLDDNMARQLFYSDTLTVFKSDSTFKQYLPGFALEVDPSAKTLLYFSLVGASKIEFYYRANGRVV